MPGATAIVLGGGVIGLSAAYHLARKQFGRIILLDKGVIGDGASSRAAGIITGHLWHQTGIEARKISLMLFRQLSEELEGYYFQEVGCLNLFDANSWPQRESLLPLYERLGVPYEILDAVHLRQRWPALHLRPDFIGLFDPLGGYSEPDDYIPALARKVRDLGVEVRQGQQMQGFEVRQGQVKGVLTSAGQIEGEVVICAVHAWTLKVIEQLGWNLPVKTFVHQRYLTRPLPAAVAIPAINANPLGGYIRPAHGNRLLVGIETAEREEYRVQSPDFHMSALSVPPGLRARARAALQSLFPPLAQLEWESEKVGLIAFSSDGEPILGPVKHLPGLYVAAAFHSGGFAYNPVAGLLLAEFVADGRPSIDVSAFAPDRFARAEVEEFLGTTVTQEEYARRHFARRH